MIANSNQLGRIVRFVTLLYCSHLVLMAEDHSASTTSASGSTVRATHILGFEGTPNNANGSLSVQGDGLRFEKNGGSSAQIPVNSIRTLALGEEDKQVGGVPLTLTRAATPFGGGRVIGFFSHKKYDTLTLEYLDSNGGLHGALFLVGKGQGQVIRSALEAKRSPASRTGDETTKRSAQESNNEGR